MDNMTKLNLLHALSNLTDGRKLGPWTSRVETVELALSDWAHRNVDNASYLSLPLPEKLTLSELKWVVRVLAA